MSNSESRICGKCKFHGGSLTKPPCSLCYAIVGHPRWQPKEEVKADNIINILGTDWTIIDTNLLDDNDGNCDNSVKIINICSSLDDKSLPGQKQDKTKYKAKVVRHEKVHALMYECGLAPEGSPNIHNEAVVDWIASIYPKLSKIMEEV